MPLRMTRTTRIGVATAGLAVLLAAALVALANAPWPRAPLAPRQGEALASARQWGYQLQYLDPSRVPPEIDVMVVDYSLDGSPAKELGREQVEALKRRPGMPPRIVLAYLSIGEAENYRFYWQAGWRQKPPHWLGGESEAWPGNYTVRFWEAGWQKLIVAPHPTVADRLREWRKPASRTYVDRVLEAGFDGVYLDRVDIFEHWQRERPGAEMEMVAFVSAISSYARRRRPGFLIVAQNGEQLVAHEHYRRAIDGLAKEDLLFGHGGDEARNRVADYLGALHLVRLARSDGLAVVVIEYLDDPAKRAEAKQRLTAQDLRYVFTSRELTRAPEPAGGN